jgi:hypothetical protein
LRFASQPGPKGDITRNHGILAHGARILSAITDGSNVLEIVSRATVRFLLLEGLDILGGGREGHGILLECEHKEHYLYNFCLRDVSVQGCGGDGCCMMGNVFEGQIINTYLRDNKRNGLTLGHGAKAGILCRQSMPSAASSARTASTASAWSTAATTPPSTAVTSC